MGQEIPKDSASWQDNWPNLSTYFKFPQEVRRLIYTTNAMEGFNRQLRKVTKAKSVFLKKGTIVDSTIIVAPSSTKNQDKQRDPDAHQVKKAMNGTLDIRPTLAWTKTAV